MSCCSQLARSSPARGIEAPNLHARGELDQLEALMKSLSDEQPAGGGAVRYQFIPADEHNPAILHVEWISN
jgi:hypothetical protein